jgi:hypothetical protein
VVELLRVNFLLVDVIQMATRAFCLGWLVGLNLIFVGQNIAQDDFELETTVVYSSDDERKNYFEERIVRIYGADFEREFSLGRKQIDLTSGKLPPEIEEQQRWAAPPSDIQKLEFDRIEKTYVQKMRDAIRIALAESSGKPEAFVSSRIKLELLALLAQKEKEVSKVWLPKQKALFKQVELRLNFEGNPAKVLQNKTIQKKLGLTVNQLAELEAISGSLIESLGELKEKHKERAGNARNARDRAIKNLLDPDQKKVLKSWLGS